jgi:hypothetical protein
MNERLDEALGTLRALVRFDLRTLFDGNSSLLPVAMWPEAAAVAVTSITSREIWSGAGSDRVLVGIEHTVKLSDRVRALELALKEMGALTDPQPRTDLDQLSDRELIERVEYHIINSPNEGHEPGHYWGVMSNEQIDADFERLCASYDLLRPGKRAARAAAEPAQRFCLPQREIRHQRRPQRP